MTKNLLLSREEEVTERWWKRRRAKGGDAMFGDAFRHLGDGRELDGDLRLRHSGEGGQDLARASLRLSRGRARRLLG